MRQTQTYTTTSQGGLGLPVQLSQSERDRLLKRKIVSLVGSVLVALSAGSNYAFSSFAPQLQEKLHLSSTQINLIGIAGNAGVYLSSPFWGRFIDQRGPRIALILASILVPLGYAGLSASYTGEWSLHSTKMLFFLNLLTGLGNSGGFTAAMNAQAKSWGGTRRGTATALVLSGFGLSAFFYSSLSHWLFPGNTGDYLLLLAFGSMASMLSGLLLIKIIPPIEANHLADGDEDGVRPSARRRRTSSVGYTSSPAYARRRTSSDIGARAVIWHQPEALSAEATDDELGEAEGRSTTQAGGAQPSSPTRQRRVIPSSHEDREVEGIEQPDEGPDNIDPESQGLLSGRNESKSRAPKEVSPETTDISGRELFKQIDFYLLFLIMTLVSGAGLLLINNVGTITKTLWDYNHRNQTDLIALSMMEKRAVDTVAAITTTSSVRNAFEALKLSTKASVQQLQAHQVSAISLCNASGRIIIGLLSDFLVNRTGSANKRVYLLIVVTTLAFGSQLLAALPGMIETVDQLLAVSTLTGLAYGTLFGLCPVLVFEWFGMAHFSQNYGFVSLSPVVAGNIFNLLFGLIYDSHVPKADNTQFSTNPVYVGIIEALNKHGGSGGDKNKDDHTGAHHLCILGEECYRQVFVITSFGCAIALVLSIILIVRRTGLPASWISFR